MTCIVGLVENGKVYIGADSGASDDVEIRCTLLPKVFRIGEFIIGYTSSFRAGQILQYHLKLEPQFDQSDGQYMVRVFIEAVRKAYTELGYIRKDNEREEGSTFLVGYRGHLYSIYSDFQVNEFSDGFDACGSGRFYALGALVALANIKPRKRIVRSIEIASQFSQTVCLPVRIEML